ncbi:MAG: hypothetical protein L0Y56_22820 [Nitrospira sp.]|nr:hypothetical protein [Nitrospira sp.]
MTVKELIKKLGNYPQSAHVILRNNERISGAVLSLEDYGDKGKIKVVEIKPIP